MTATTVVLPITQNGDYKNVNIKPKWNKKSLKFEGGLADNEIVFFEKVFKEGTKVPSTKFTNKDGSPSISYSCKAKDTQGNEVSFWLNEAEHQIFANLGDKGTKFSVTSKKEVVINPKNGMELTVFRLTFKAE